MSFRTFHKLYITLFLAPETNSKVISQGFFFIIFKSRGLRNLPFNCIMLSNVGFNFKSCCSEVGKANFLDNGGKLSACIEKLLFGTLEVPPFAGFCMNQVSHCGAFATSQEENVTCAANSLAEWASMELTESFLFRPLR